MTRSLLRSAMFLAAVVTIAVASYSVGAASASPTTVVRASLQPSGGGVCYHTAVSDYVCPDSASRQFLFPPDYIQEVDLTVVARNGMRRTIKLPGNADGVFLTKEATEKFLLSYYWAVNRAKADRLHSLLTPVAGR
jgi:hypothetical protein